MVRIVRRWVLLSVLIVFSFASVASAASPFGTYTNHVDAVLTSSTASYSEPENAIGDADGDYMGIYNDGQQHTQVLLDMGAPGKSGVLVMYYTVWAGTGSVVFYDSSMNVLDEQPYTITQAYLGHSAFHVATSSVFRYVGIKRPFVANGELYIDSVSAEPVSQVRTTVYLTPVAR